MRHQESYHIGEMIGSLSQRVSALEELREKVKKLEEAGHTTRRLLLLLALSTAASVGNIKAEFVGEMLATVIKSGLK